LLVAADKKNVANGRLIRISIESFEMLVYEISDSTGFIKCD
jgi:hypothetical protein